MIKSLITNLNSIIHLGHIFAHIKGHHFIQITFELLRSCREYTTSISGMLQILNSSLVYIKK